MIIFADYDDDHHHYLCHDDGDDGGDDDDDDYDHHHYLCRDDDDDVDQLQIGEEMNWMGSQSRLDAFGAAERFCFRLERNLKETWKKSCRNFKELKQEL